MGEGLDPGPIVSALTDGVQLSGFRAPEKHVVHL
ncbi:hypothetical protein XHV734_3013 [Xanthomonas hortorum pv. vitians]|nr:hypothetical protein XHV734_3013 [Xanthomonas hortorum pv. vitians]